MEVPEKKSNRVSVPIIWLGPLGVRDSMARPSLYKSTGTVESHSSEYTVLERGEVWLIRMAENHLRQFVQCDGMTVFLELVKVAIDRAPPYTALFILLGGFGGWGCGIL